MLFIILRDELSLCLEKKKIQEKQFKADSDGFFYVSFVEKVFCLFSSLVPVLIFDQ